MNRFAAPSSEISPEVWADFQQTIQALIRRGVELEQLQAILRQRALNTDAAVRETKADLLRRFPETPSAAQTDPGLRPATRYDDEWLDYQAIVRVLFSEVHVDPQDVQAILDAYPIETLEDLATVNAKLWSLATEPDGKYRVPREWLMRRVRRNRKQAEFKAWVRKVSGLEEFPMGWFKRADDGLLEHKLPTLDRPKPAGPLDGALEVSLGLPEPPGPPSGLGPAAPGKKPEVERVKALLDQGKLKEALEALKRLVPPEAPKPKDKGPEKGSLPELKDKESREEKPKDEAKHEEPKQAQAAIELTCGGCGVLLDTSCPKCRGRLSCGCTA